MKCTELKKDGADIQRGKVLLALEGATARIEAAEAALIAAGWDSTNCAEDGGQDGTLVVFFVVDRCDVKGFRAAWKKAKADSLTATPDEGDLAEAAEARAETDARIAADVEASAERTRASLAELDAARRNLAALAQPTGRLSSSAPDLQDLPGAAGLGPRVGRNPRIAADFGPLERRVTDVAAAPAPCELPKGADSKTFVLSASSIDGVCRHESPEAYRAEHGAARFCHPDDFYDYLRTMAAGEYWATEVDPVGDASFIARIDREYGIH